MSSLTTFKFDPKLVQTIEDLKKNSGAASKAEIVRRAIALLKVVQEASDRGEEIVLVKDGSSTQTKIVLP